MARNKEMRHIYNITPLTNANYTGKGQTIVIVDSYGSPTIQQDLRTFDKGFGLPNPPSFRVLAPLGTVPFDDTNADEDSWALETTIDVEWSHAIAPDANIVLLTSPVDETQGIQGLPEFLQLEQYALDHHLGNIISQSWSTAENTLFNPTDQHIFGDFDALYKRAAAQHVKVLCSAAQ
jgi:subtilase family serine protease